MPDYDAGFKIVARESGRALAELGDVVCDAWEPVTGEVHAAERLADRAFRARKGKEAFIVYMEAYTRWVTKAPWSVLAKSGLLSERERLPCKCLVYVLLPRGYKEQHGTFLLAVEGQSTQQIWFREICLWKLTPRPDWEDDPGLMALYPLFDHQQTPEKSVARAAQAIRRQSTDTIRKADLLTVLALFGKLASPGFNPLDIIGREAMRESPLYQELVQEGRVEAHRDNILKTVKVRFGKLSADGVIESLKLVDDINDLTELFDKALQSRSIAAFRKLLLQKTKSQPAH
jgi:hypothetical protein